MNKNNGIIKEELEIKLETLKQKRDEVDSLIYKYVAGATLVGGSPIPFADAPILMMGQIKMISSIFEAYEIEFSPTKEVIFSLILNRMVSQGAKYVVKYTLKKLAVGVGAVVSASMAGAVTYTMGKAVSKVAYELKESSLKSGEFEKNMNKINKLIDESIAFAFKEAESVGTDFFKNKLINKDKLVVR
ncbi:DUF697 domain-containing protein [Cetobacterium sp.]|uniref:DUF697 domain-containing protein n=1 Tax=Cetobacterium sp. TaxID=2071632 RepID=UPI003EE53AC2